MLKKEKKERLVKAEREAAARKILEQGKTVNSLMGSELTALLKKRQGMEKCQGGGRNGGRLWRHRKLLLL